jgi:hypothetical protein
MSASLNLHRLFYTDDGYLSALRVSDADQSTLSTVREKARKAIREAFRNWEKFVTKADLFESSEAGAGFPPTLPAPKFRLQGSFAYHTVNDCQRTPPQQIDQDDGMFLPVSFIVTGGGVRPRITAKAYFTIVEAALRPLCSQEGWTLNPGGPKDTCVRIGISPRLHLDIPLYAVRDEAFEQLVESSARVLAKSDSMTFDAAAFSDQEELPEDVYRALDESELVLAHRQEGWRGSDPRMLEFWFDNAISVYGPIVRRLSRAFKGLRDAHWSECELGSICIMAAVVQAVTRTHPLDRNRDDLALITVGREMVKIFSAPIENPAFPGDADKNLCNGWSDEFRGEVRRVFAAACDNLERAVFEAPNKGIAINLAREAFGDRVPPDQSLISLVGVAAVIRQVEPAPQPKPMVPRTKSG